MRHRTFQTFCRLVWRSVRLLLVTLVVLLFGRQASAQVIRVDIDSPGNGPGSTWANAFDNLQDAITFASDPDNDVVEIWVAEGTYKPHASNQSVSFVLDDLGTEPGGLQLLGGFDGTETVAEDRKIALNVTILSGDLAGDDAADFVDHDENSWHVISAEDVTDSVVIDGFTIKGGYADGTGDDDNGGGAYIVASDNTQAEILGPRFVDCKFEDNYASAIGGAIYGGTSSNAMRLNIRHCRILNNKAATNGGGIGGHTGVIRNSTILNNIAGTNGGGVYFGTTHVLLGCTITDNIAETGSGGGVYVQGGSGPDLVSCYVARNYADVSGGGLHNNASHGVRLTSCAFVENHADGEEANGVGGGGRQL